MISIFVVITIAVSAIVTFFNQVKQFRSLCSDRLRGVDDYLIELIQEDPDDFISYVNYYKQHYKEIRIPLDFDESNYARDRFFTSFRSEYPGKTFKVDVTSDELSDEVSNLYYTWRHEYWLLNFEKAREAFYLPYTYFLLPDDETHYTMYMIDGERIEDPYHKGYLYLGDSYYEDPAEHELLWKTWQNGVRYDEIYEWNNEWGNTYSCYTPLVIRGETIGLVVSEIDVSYVNGMIGKETLLLILQLSAILILLTALLLYFINRYHISRIIHLSGQINEFSSTRAYDTVDAIRQYPYGSDEISVLADNTADMIRELQVHEEKIAQAAQFKSDFLANMSHEIRTPMNAIVGLSELALKEDLPDKGREYVKQINSSASTMLVIINDILDFSRIEDGILEITPADYDVKVAVYDVVTMASMGLDEKHVSMKLDIAPDLPRYLRGDCARIRQVIGNVVSNAVKFTKEGSIFIKIGYEPLDDDNAINLLITVSDTGIGIKEEDYERIFESFSQIDSKRNREVEGTGLGLAISQRLVNRMNGTIEVESEYGVGSEFRICIPQQIAQAPETAGQAASGEAPAEEKELKAPGANVLVVDDNSINLYVARNLLGLYDIKSTCVLSGKLALKAVSKYKYDLILMDYMMPNMDGIETTHKIREEYPEYRDVPVIAFTANAVEEAREKLLKEGMDDFIAKPVKNKDLENLLIKWLPKDRWE